MEGLISYDHEILNGKPVLKGTRIPVKIIYDLLAQNFSIDEILDLYPTISKEMVEKLIEMADEIQQSITELNIKAYS